MAYSKCGTNFSLYAGPRALLSCLAALSLCFLCLDSANADVISNLYSTGVDNAGTPLPDGTVDTHYALISSPSGAGSTAFVTNSNSWPLGTNGPWVSNSTTAPNGITSKWISPLATESGGNPFGRYIYQTTFSISTGLNPSTASIMGAFAVDNPGTIYLNQSLTAIGNGTATASASVTSQPTFTFDNHSFNITSGFVRGLNTLDLVVDNLDGPNPNPTGLRLALAGTVFPGFTAVPEPATLFGAAIGFIGLAGYGLNRRRLFA